MKVGYSYWGYLGDIKYDKDSNRVSTPDGNAIYSWSIIHELQNIGQSVTQLMPDRDRPGFKKLKKDLFYVFASDKRYNAYISMRKTIYDNFDWQHKANKEELFKLWDKNRVNELDVILHEWRMKIPGRNDYNTMLSDFNNWQPDYLIQECLVEYVKIHHINFIIFDLDYKITKEEYTKMFNDSAQVHLFELGHKWQGTPNCFNVQIPFTFEELRDGWQPVRKDNFKYGLVYIGNRYERDEYIDKYILGGGNSTLFGNWLENNRCSDKRWPDINFGHRLQPNEIGQVYNSSICTVLLAKEEYYKYGFMTARIIEAVYYGCVPLFPEEYGKDIIEKYAGKYANQLTVISKPDVAIIYEELQQSPELRVEIIEYLRKRLAVKMNAYNICQDIINIGRGTLEW